MSQFEVAVAAVRSAAAKDIAALARREHAKIMGENPRPLNFVRFVDGRKGAAEETVKTGGVIVYDYNRLDVIARDALDLLQKASPVRSGAYRSGHALYINLRPVDNLAGWKPGDEISITNTVPYSRVIELGRRGKDVIKFSMPPHIYERVAAALRRSYRGVATIEFTFRAVLGKQQLSKNTPVSRSVRKQRDVADTRWPTIIIKPAA